MIIIVVSDKYECSCGKWRCNRNYFEVQSYGPFETIEDAQKCIGHESWWEDYVYDTNSFISIDVVEVESPQNFKNPIPERELQLDEEVKK